ncbi:MAG: DNA internalization-related competence protein ComEC/Rec2 [Veillonellaceae bacterium]|nr:DNA internalization-related competence protein ComEC/Rec2 [Veillonellaceae bacterium]
MVKYAGAFALGIFVAGKVGAGLVWCLILTWILTLAVMAGRSRRRGRDSSQWLSVALLLLWCLAGIIRLTSVNENQPFSVREYIGRKVTVQGNIRGVPQILNGSAGERRVRYELELKHRLASAEGLPQPLRGGLRITAAQAESQPVGAAGDSMVATGTIRRFNVYHNPGQPDAETALAVRGLDARMTALPGTLRITRHDGMATFADYLFRWRTQVRTALLQAMPNTDASLVMGMLFGGYDGIDRQTVRDFAATGIVHILSVSGSHIALVAGAIFWLTRRVGLHDTGSAMVAGLAMIAYGLISGFSAPVVRSVVMGAIAMAAIGLGQRDVAARALTLAVIGMLVYEPRYLFDISFQLSVACTGGLLFFAPFLQECLEPFKRCKATRFAVTGIGATVAAELAVLPLQAWYFGVLPTYSLLANVIVVPLLETVILAGLAGIVLAGGMTGVSQVIFVGISLLTGMAVELNRFLSRLPLAVVSLPAFGLWGCAGYYFVITWLCGIWKIADWSPSDVRRKMKKNPVKSAGLTLFAAACVALAWQQPGPLQVHFIDVGQGDATLVITPHGRSVLIDTGGTPGPQTEFDVGERVVVPYLRHYGVSTVDCLILTHNHQDHAGGAAAVANMLGVRQALLHVPESDESPAILRLRRAMRNRGMRDAADVEKFKVDGVCFQLYQAGNAVSMASGRSVKKQSESENGQSTVVRIEFGRYSFLVTGDLEGESETRIGKMPMGMSTVLKVGHHGGRKSTQREFLTKVCPQYAVISVGVDNRYGHPAPETLNRLREWPVGLFRTDRDGAVVFHSNGQDLTVSRTIP